MDMNKNEDWLLRLEKLEDCGPISVGGTSQPQPL